MHPSLDDFELHARAGRGGHGEVWRGVHRGSGTPVALKLLGEQEDPLREVRWLAGLSHPTIVRVYGFGQLSEARLGRAAGTGWFAMEWLGRQTRGWRPENWASAHRVIRELLAGLAHAHARSVIHCDIKPANLLFDDAGRVRITDFGISGRPGRSDEVRGTPTYMAPEQVTQESLGPWTDLYALGVVLWEWLMGAPPFVSRDPHLLVQAHRHAPLPAFVPLVDVPASVETWVSSLLEKSPRRRCRHAADALENLPEPEGEAVQWLAAGEVVDRDGTVTWTQGVDRVEAVHDDVWSPSPVVPMPRSPPHHPLAGHVLRGSLATRPQLVRLRAAPPFASDEVRARLWQALVDVGDRGTPARLSLNGPKGVGHGLVARWLCEAARVAGAAHTWWLRQDTVRDRDLATLAGERPGVDLGLHSPNLRRLLDGQELAMLPQQRAAFIQALVSAVASERPLIVIDERGALAPCEAPVLHLRFDADGVGAVELRPLDMAQATEFAQSQVPLSIAAARELARWSGGLPELMSRAIVHWCEGDLLEVGEHGLEPCGPPPASAVDPDPDTLSPESRALLVYAAASSPGGLDLVLPGTWGLLVGAGWVVSSADGARFVDHAHWLASRAWACGQPSWGRVCRALSAQAPTLSLRMELWLDGGAVDEALHAFLFDEAAGRHPRAQRIEWLERCEGADAALLEPARHAERGRQALDRGALDEVREHLTALGPLESLPGVIRTAARRLRSSLAARTGDVDAAIAEIRRAIDEDPVDEALSDLYELLLVSGQWEEAARGAEVMHQRAVDARNWRRAAHAASTMTGVRLALRDTTEASLWCDRYVDAARQGGSLAFMGAAMNQRGEIARKSQQIEDALRWYREAADAMHAGGYPSWIPELNVSVLLVDHFDPRGALDGLTRVEGEVSRAGFGRLAGAVLAVRIKALAKLDERADAEASVERIQCNLADAMRTPEIRDAIEQAAAACTDRGWPDLAVRLGPDVP